MGITLKFENDFICGRVNSQCYWLPYFIVDSNRLSRLLAQMVGHMAEEYGKRDSTSFTKEELQELQNKISTSIWINTICYIQFILGFALQLFPLLWY